MCTLSGISFADHRGSNERISVRQPSSLTEEALVSTVFGSASASGMTVRRVRASACSQPLMRPKRVSVMVSEVR